MNTISKKSKSQTVKKLPAQQTPFYKKRVSLKAGLRRVYLAFAMCFVISGAAFAECSAPWDEKQIIREGDHLWAYLAPTGDHLGKCRKQQRVCRGGQLLGTYDFKECVFKNGCTTEFGFIPEGGEVTAYHSPTGDQEGGACLAEKRYCSKGTFTGSFSFLACQPRVDKKSNKPSVVFKD